MIPSQFAQHVIAEQRHWWFIARRDILSGAIAEMYGAEGPKLIVEVGCGTGGTCSILWHKYGFNVTGFDTSEDAINIARKTYVGIPFHHYEDIEELREYLAQADLVLLLDVLEHIEYDTGFLSVIVSMMPVGAQLLLTVPAMMALWGKQDDVVGHFRRYDSNTLQNSWRGLPVNCIYYSYFNSHLYIPILVARTLSRWFGISFGKDGMDYSVPTRPVNTILTKIFRSEGRRIRNLAKRGYGKGYSRGASLIALLQKTA